MDFLIIFAVFGIMGVPLMLFFIVYGDNAKERIGGCLVVLAFWLMMSGGLYFLEKGNDERWNDGYCSCGTHWELSEVTRSRHIIETKYYSCPNCYKETVIRKLKLFS